MGDIRIGVAGLGGRGRWWLQLLQRIPGFRITALCDPIPTLHERALASIPYRQEVTATTDYAELLADDRVEAVGLTVRCREQGALAAMALEAGKHVHAEVPAAHTLEDCWRIVLAVEQTGRIYQLAEQCRYWGFIDAWRDLVAGGSLGHVTYCEGQYFGDYTGYLHFHNPETGEFCPVEELAAHPEAQPTWLHQMPPIHYLPHELSPMLKVLDDRVIEVTAMSTRSPSYAHPPIAQPDIQVALMKTEKGAILRLAAGFTQPGPHHDHHWYQVIGSRGRVEWKRSDRDHPKLWLAGQQMHGFAEVDWRFERADAATGARGSGHGDADYYVHTAFRDAVLGVRALEFDVYGAMDTAAPAILAADSIARGTQLLHVPDFRPGPARPMGKSPRE